jgi:hypothetical protein
LAPLTKWKTPPMHVPMVKPMAKSSNILCGQGCLSIFHKVDQLSFKQTKFLFIFRRKILLRGVPNPTTFQSSLRFTICTGLQKALEGDTEAGCVA